MTQKKRSPWATSHDDKSNKNAPELSVEAQQSEWIRQETIEIDQFLSTERATTLNHVVTNLLPRFPNEAYGLQILSLYAVHFDELHYGAMLLATGGQSIDDMVMDYLSLHEDDRDRLTFFTSQMDRLVELEMDKQYAQDAVAFKSSLIAQVLTLCDIYRENLKIEERNGEASDHVLGIIIEQLTNRKDSNLSAPYPTPQKEEPSQWPFIEPLLAFHENLKQLSLQSAATLAQLEFQVAQSEFPDTTIEAAILYAEIVEQYMTLMRNNLMQEIQDGTYFIELSPAVYDMAEMYGQDAHNPDVEWQLDENMMIQFKAGLLSARIIGAFEEEGLDEAEPARYTLLKRAARDFNDLVEEHYPVDMDKKPAFVKQYEQRLVASSYQDTQKSDIIDPEKTGRKASPSKPSL